MKLKVSQVLSEYRRNFNLGEFELTCGKSEDSGQSRMWAAGQTQGMVPRGKHLLGMICPGSAFSYWPLASEKQHDWRGEGMRRGESIDSVGLN